MRPAATSLAGSVCEIRVTAPDYPEVELALISTALAGDAGGLYRVASNLMEQGVPFDSLLFDYLLAAERSVGQRWAQADYSVAEEHVVTATIETVISLLIGMLDQPQSGPHVVVATAEGDEHSLPARAAAANLVFLGHRTTFLGSNIPSGDLGAFLGEEPPVALVLSVAMTTHLLGARSAVHAAHQVDVPVLVGGKAFGDSGQWADAIGADAYVGSLREVAETIERWLAGDAPEPRSIPELPSDLQQLIDSRTAILTAVEGELGTAATRLNDEARLLLGALEAVLLTGDDEVLAEMLDWQEKTMRAYGLEPDVVVEAVSDAVAGHSGPGAEALRRTRAERA